MSRVDDALRRAAELQAAQTTLTEQATAPAAAEAVASGDDIFPVETFESEAAASPPHARRRDDLDVLRPAGPEVLRRDSAQPRVASSPPAIDSSSPAALFERIDSKFAEKVIVDRKILPASREQYRRLAAVLHDAQNETGLKVVMIASAMAGEGKTLTASNLAMTFSASYRRRVLLVDGDLRRPVLHSVFRVDSSTGLSEGLKSADGSSLVVRQVSPWLSLLPGGRPDADPMAGLTSSRMRRVIDEARSAFDWVVIDTPPLALLPDAHLLASMVDAVILVIRANRTPHAMVKRVVDAVGKERILGVVLNATTGATAGADDYDYSYASSSTELEPARPRP